MILENKTLFLTRGATSGAESPGHVTPRRAHGVGSYHEAVSQAASTATTVTLQLIAAEKHLMEQKNQIVLSIPFLWFFHFCVRAPMGKVLRSSISSFRH